MERILEVKPVEGKLVPPLPSRLPGSGCSLFSGLEVCFDLWFRQVTLRRILSVPFIFPYEL